MVIIMKKLALILMSSFLCQYGIAQDAVSSKDINTTALTEDYLLGKWKTSLTLDKNECLDMFEKMDAGASEMSSVLIKEARNTQEFTGHCKLVGVSTYHRNYDVSDYLVLSVRVDMLTNPLALGEMAITSTSKWQIYEAHKEVVITMKKENFNLNLDYVILNDDIKTTISNEFDDAEIDAMKKEAITNITNSLPNEIVSTNKIEILGQDTMKVTDLETKLELIYHRE